MGARATIALLGIVAESACGAAPAHVEVDVAGAPSPEVERKAPRAALRRERVWVERDAADFADGDADARVGVTYDCRGFGPERAPRAKPIAASIAELVRVVDPSSSDTLASSEATVSALDAVARLEPERLDVFERVVVTNTALSVVLRVSSDEYGAVPLAKVVARAFALPAETLEALGAEVDPVVERWLGPRALWSDRKGVSCGDGRALRHDRTYRGARAFRPVRSGDTRALVAQLVAIDTDGMAHVTPYVGEIEVLRGAGAARSTCVAELDADGLRAGAPGGLRRVRREGVPHTPFIKPAGAGAFGCGACHAESGSGGAGDFADVPRDEGASLMQNRRRAVGALLSSESSWWSEPPEIP